MTCDRANRNTQISAAKAYAVAFANKDARQEASEENSNPPVFVPSIGVRHRAFKRKSIEGTFIQEAELIIAEETADVCIDSFPPAMARKHLRKILMEVVVLAMLGVRECHRCKGEFLKNKCPPPKISHFVWRPCKYGKTQKTRGWCQHLLLLQHVMWTKTQQREMVVEDVTIAKDTFTLLMPTIFASFTKGIHRDNCSQTKCWKAFCVL